MHLFFVQKIFFHNTFHTIFTHLVPFCQLIVPSICCVHRRIVEGSGVGSAGYVVHVDVHTRSELC